VTRFLHTADWQLGMTRHFLSPEAQGRFAQDRIDAVREIGVIAREQRAEFVVVSVDVSADLDRPPRVEEFPVGRWRFVEQRFSLDA
jgi:DNA repair exonuclease SbcCD nuclease subunit